MSSVRVWPLGPLLLLCVAGCHADPLGSPDLALDTPDLGQAPPDLFPSTPPEVSVLAGALNTTGADDGTGEAARFNHPIGITSDGAGSLYVADTDNHVIRKVDLDTAKVTTIAGQAGTADFADGDAATARFSAPQGVAFYMGVLYVVDTENHAVRALDVASGNVTTLAGNGGFPGSYDGYGGTARFQYPRAICSDDQGTLYVADAYNHAIRRISISTGQVTTPAGELGMTGYADGVGAGARFNTPEGLTLDGQGHLLVSDTFNDAIREIDLATGAVTTVAGSPGMTGYVDGTSAQFNGPSGLLMDGASGLYISDTFNSLVRYLDLSIRNVSTVLGTPGGGTITLGPPTVLGRPASLVRVGQRIIFADWQASAILVAK
jgi:sugar lactone lactonase YvrE